MTEPTDTGDSDRGSHENPKELNDGDTQPEDDSQDTIEGSSVYGQLSAFERDILVLVRGLDTPKGMEILEELEQYYKEDVNHGRLYPNLDDLVESGYVEKVSIDGRSNGYLLTDQGNSLLQNRRHWEEDQVSQLSVEEPGSRTEEPASRRSEHKQEEGQESTRAPESSDSQEQSEEPSQDIAGNSELVDDLIDDFDDMDKGSD